MIMEKSKEFNLNTKKMFLTLSDLDKCSLWWMDSHDDTYHEAFKLKNLPDEVRPQDLIIRANFTSPKNIKLKGYIIGYKNIFAVAIFIKNKKYIFNKNLPELCLKYFYEISQLFSSEVLNKPEDLFPVHYESDSEDEDLIVLSGKFNAFENIKSERGERWKKK